MSFESMSADIHIEKIGVFYKCNICKISLNSLSQVRSHVSGNSHISRARSLSVNTKSVGEKLEHVQIQDTPKICDATDLLSFIVPSGLFYKCICCDVPLNSLSQVDLHVSGKKHEKAAKSFQPDCKTELNFKSEFTDLFLNVNSNTEDLKNLKCFQSNEQIVF